MLAGVALSGTVAVAVVLSIFGPITLYGIWHIVSNKGVPPRPKEGFTSEREYQKWLNAVADAQGENFLKGMRPLLELRGVFMILSAISIIMFSMVLIVASFFD